MAIPWLIGAAAVGAAAWLLSDSKEEKEQRAREKRWEEEDRIREEAREEIERAKRAEERRQQEAQALDLEQFAYAKGKSLADKYGIDGFPKNLKRLAINDPEKCEQEFKRIFLQSGKLSDMNVQKAAFESEILEIDALSALLVNMDKNDE